MRYLVLIFLLVGLALGIYYYRQRQATSPRDRSIKASVPFQVQLEDEEYIKEPVTTQESASIVNTTTGTIYSNSELGFSLTLPPGWSIDSERSDRTKSGDDVVFRPVPGLLTESHEGISVDAVSGKTVDDYANQIDKKIILSTGTIMIDGETGKFIETGEFATTYAFVIHGGRVYRFTSQRMISEGILSTFKFLQ